MADLLLADTPDIHALVTEDDTPVDNFPSEKAQRLLTEPLYSSWVGPGADRSFLAAANVGVFYLARNPAIVPDVLVSLDVDVAKEWWERAHRSYFLWEFGKPPDIAIEIVSNTKGGEDDDKKQKYARMRVSYYVIYDPQLQVMTEALTVYRLHDFNYEKQPIAQFPSLNLGLTVWEGTFENKHDVWLRWTDTQGNLILTGKERADQAERQVAQAKQQVAQAEQQVAQAEQQVAQAEQQVAQERQEKAAAMQQLEHERQRAERLAALLRQLGQDPEQL